MDYGRILRGDGGVRKSKKSPRRRKKSSSKRRTTGYTNRYDMAVRCKSHRECIDKDGNRGKLGSTKILCCGLDDKTRKPGKTGKCTRPVKKGKIGWCPKARPVRNIPQIKPEYDKCQEFATVNPQLWSMNLPERQLSKNYNEGLEQLTQLLQYKYGYTINDTHERENTDAEKYWDSDIANHVEEYWAGEMWDSYFYHRFGQDAKKTFSALIEIIYEDIKKICESREIPFEYNPDNYKETSSQLYADLEEDSDEDYMDQGRGDSGVKTRKSRRRKKKSPRRKKKSPKRKRN